MLGTFSAVLVFTMFKEAFEDYQRHKQDNDLNNRTSKVFKQARNKFFKKKWQDLKMGQLLKVKKDHEFPADLVLLKSSRHNGLAYVDTMNLDGETNLKERSAPKEFQDMEREELCYFDGELACDGPNEHLDRFDGNISSDNFG